MPASELLAAQLMNNVDRLLNALLALGTSNTAQIRLDNATVAIIQMLDSAPQQLSHIVMTADVHAETEAEVALLT